MLFPWLYFIVFILRYFSYTKIIDTCINLNIPQKTTPICKLPTPPLTPCMKKTRLEQFSFLIYCVFVQRDFRV